MSCIMCVAKVDWSEWENSKPSDPYSDCPPAFNFGKYSYMPIPGSENEVCLINGSLYFKIFTNGPTPDLLDTTFDGVVEIPETVNYNGVEYTVAQIDFSVDFMNTTELTFPSSIKSIGGTAPKLSELTLPEGLQEIQSNSFSDNKLISQLSPPSSLRLIGSDCFSKNEISRIEFAEGLMEIGANSFSDNPNLIEALLPNSLLRIGENCFGNCGNLQTVQLPRWSISNYQLFNGCPSITKIICSAKIPPMVYESFDAVNKDLCVIVVPKGCAEEYRNAFFWKDFKNIVESELSNIETVDLPTSAITDSEVYKINGIKINDIESAEKGDIIISGGKKIKIAK